MPVRVLVTCMCLALALGCGKSATVATDRLQVGDTAPSFVAKDIFGCGNMITAEKTFHSNSVTVIVIWNMDCPDCREALLDVERVYDQYGVPGFAFIGLNNDLENLPGARAFLKGEGFDLPTYYDGGSRITRLYRALDYTFSIFLVNRESKVIMAQYDHPPDLGDIITERLEEAIRSGQSGRE